MRAERVDVAAVRPLRLAVLRPGGVPADAVWEGDDDPGATHFAVRSGEAVVAVASLVPEPHPVAPRAGDLRLRGMATDPAWRGRGLGALLVAAAVGHARGAGAGRVWCSARIGAVRFYAHAGFVAETGPFDVPGLGRHVRMARALR